MSEFKNVIAGVSCDVSDCVYHCADCSCAAGTIRVSGGANMGTNDTVCDTYKSKDCKECKDCSIG